MASNAFTDADAQLGGGSALYGNQNGGASPTQQHQHLSPDNEMQLQEGIAQLTRSNEMMHVGQPPHHMGAPVNTAHHFQTPPRPTHSPQQMAQIAAHGLEDHVMYSGELDSSRKRSKVSRACDECRRKKAWLNHSPISIPLLTTRRFDATQPAKTARKHVQAVSVLARDVSLVDSR